MVGSKDKASLVDIVPGPGVPMIKGPVPESFGGDLGLNLWHTRLRWAAFLGALWAGWRAAGIGGLIVAELAFVAFCVLWWWTDTLGWLDTIFFMYNDSKKPPVSYTHELHHAPDGEDYAMWWAARGRGDTLWIIVPGGMNDGTSPCQQTCVRPALDLPSTDVCVFHMPGQGGTKIKKRFGPGLCDVTYLVDFMQKPAVQDKYKTVLVVGLSAGGLVLPNLLAAVSKLTLSFQVRGVMLGSPDYMRHAFEDMSSWMTRLDVYFTVWYFMVTSKSGLVDILQKRWKFPWRPSWNGYMKPASAAAMCLGQDRQQLFEEIEGEHFCGAARTKPPLPLLRMHGINDCCIRPRVLHEEGFRNVEVWWMRRGGHCGQWEFNPGLASAVAAWAARAQ